MSARPTAWRCTSSTRTSSACSTTSRRRAAARARARRATSARSQSSWRRRTRPCPSSPGPAMPDFDAETERLASSRRRKRSPVNSSGGGSSRPSAALEAVANHLAGVRGRKNLVWVSSGFPIGLRRRIRPGMRRPDRSAARCGPSTTPTSRSTRSMRADCRRLRQPGGPRRRSSTRSRHPSPTSTPCRRSRTETGGRAFFNTNAIGDAIRPRDRRLARQLRARLLPRARPDGTAGSMRSRSRCAAPDCDVRHRKGYLAIPVKATQNLTRRRSDPRRDPIAARGHRHRPDGAHHRGGALERGGVQHQGGSRQRHAGQARRPVGRHRSTSRSRSCRPMAASTTTSTPR